MADLDLLLVSKEKEPPIPPIKVGGLGPPPSRSSATSSIQEVDEIDVHITAGSLHQRLSSQKIFILNRLRHVALATYQAHFAPRPFHWLRSPILYLSVALRWYLVVILYFPGSDLPVQHRLNLARSWVWDGVSGPVQPGVGGVDGGKWEDMKLEWPIWREDMVFVVKTKEREAFEAWKDNWEGMGMGDVGSHVVFAGREDGDGNDRGGKVEGMLPKGEEWWKGKDGDGQCGEVRRAVLWDKENGRKMEDGNGEWESRAEIVTHICALQTAYERFLFRKMWYILLDDSTYPILPSLVFLLSRLDPDRAYFLTFGSTSILSWAAVERLFETHAFTGLSLGSAENEDEKASSSLTRGFFGIVNGESRGMRVRIYGDAVSWGDAVLQTAARRRNIIPNNRLSHLFNNIAPHWTHISPQNQCDIILGFHGLTPSQLILTSQKIPTAPAPAWPLQNKDLWHLLGGYPEFPDNENGYFGTYDWDNVGKTSENVTMRHHMWGGHEYAEYSDGTWSITLENVSNDCQMACYEGGLRDPWGTSPRCVAYKSEAADRDGLNGWVKCTFAPWKVVGEKREGGWTMINDFRESGECPEMEVFERIGGMFAAWPL